MVSYLFLCLCFFKIVVYGDHYAGVFNKNDFLVAQDNLYKERVPYRVTQSMYGRYFRCPITYYRVMDRLGMGRGPRVLLTRGGLRHKFLTLRITSQYNQPTSVTILVGCENKKKLTTKPPTTVPPGGGMSTSTSGVTGKTPGGDASTSSSGVTGKTPGGDASTSSSGVASETPGGDASTSSSGVTSETTGGDASTSSSDVTSETTGGDASTTPADANSTPSST